MLDSAVDAGVAAAGEAATGVEAAAGVDVDAAGAGG